MPKKMVPIAAPAEPEQGRRRDEAAQAPVSVSSGIFGMVGVETKLKYQSKPIHITPQITCSQRKVNELEGRAIETLDIDVKNDQKQREHEARDHHIAQISQKRGHGPSSPIESWQDVRRSGTSAHGRSLG